MRREFLVFLKKNNIAGLAIAVVIGTKVTALVTSVVNDLVTPLLLKPALDAARVGAIQDLTLGGVLYGKVLAAFIDFFLVAIVVFLFAKFILREETSIA